ncbi:MAG: hypothetical protein BJ554DRAFT_4277 [Olpidium bornovanus]|uniref:Uncharacterized protein n=1 Tax=Olpidium bornovanus TaxID=278681 RepID=A0A8H8DFB9_9FUNG|nr:MAG: hypothetical protein BJ554DRAFT_4277 [Olpidium bornovanus]
MPLITMTGFPSSGKTRRANEILAYFRTRMAAEEEGGYGEEKIGSAGGRTNFAVHVIDDALLGISKSAYAGIFFLRRSSRRRVPARGTSSRTPAFPRAALPDLLYGALGEVHLLCGTGQKQRAPRHPSPHLRFYVLSAFLTPWSNLTPPPTGCRDLFKVHAAVPAEYAAEWNRARGPDGYDPKTCVRGTGG